MKPLYRFYIANDSTSLYDSSALIEDNVEYEVSATGTLVPVTAQNTETCTIEGLKYTRGLWADPKKSLTRLAYTTAKPPVRWGVRDYASTPSFFIQVPENLPALGISLRGSSSDLPPIYLARQAYPIFGDDLKKEWKKENGQAFFRQSLKGKLKFVKDDYAYIMAASLGSYHCVKVERSMDNGETWEDFFEGYFRRTDARIVPEDNLIEVQLNTFDLYEAILNKQDQEFDLIKLAPEIGSLTLFKRPAIQLYTPGENVLSTFVGGVYWEQECEAIDDLEVLNIEHGFSMTTIYGRVLPYKTDQSDSIKYAKYLGIHKVTLVPGGEPTMVPLFGPISTVENISLYIVQSAGIYPTTRLLTMDSQGITVAALKPSTYDWDGFYHFENNLLLDGVGLYYVKENWIGKDFVGRLLHDNEGVPNKVSLLGKTAFGENRNYKYASPFSDLQIQASLEVSSTPTEYGQSQPGEYYKRPLAPLSAPGFYLPISKSHWGEVSYWLKCGTYLENVIDAEYRREYTLKHAYPLHSCFSVLLKQLAPGISFSNTAAHSEFFYNNSANLIAQAISGLSNLHITPITNMLKGEYDQPAQKCSITLKDLFNLVKDLFNCYWYIDGTKLRIEHIRYFNNGLTYIGGPSSAQPDVDATKLIAPRVRETWLLGQSEYKYDLDNLPERYEFSWPDDVTEPFTGWPIEVKSGYVKKGEIHEISVSKFAADLDFMLLRPESFNEDEIAVLAPDATGNMQYLQQNLGAIGDDFYAEYYLQNGQLSFISLVPRYYRDNISGKDVIINKVKYQNTLSLNVIRTKEQVINIPFVEGLTENSLVKTSLGVGKVDAMELNLNSNVVKITLKHATE